MADGRLIPNIILISRRAERMLAGWLSHNTAQQHLMVAQLSQPQLTGRAKKAVRGVMPRICCYVILGTLILACRRALAAAGTVGQ